MSERRHDFILIDEGAPNRRILMDGQELRGVRKVVTETDTGPSVVTITFLAQTLYEDKGISYNEEQRRELLAFVHEIADGATMGEIFEKARAISERERGKSPL